MLKAAQLIELQKEFEEKLGLQVYVPKPGGGNTNDGVFILMLIFIFSGNIHIQSA